jgi:putative peptidoglycan lipid II flippase
MDDFRSTVSSTLRAILFLSLPATIGLIMLRVPLIQVLLERGAFDARSTEWVSAALGFYALGLAGHSAVEILSRAFYALHDTIRPVAVGLGAMGLNIILSLILGRPAEDGGMAHAGLALANSIATLLEMIVLWVLLTRKAEGMPWREVGVSFLRTLAASVVMGAVLWSFLYYLGDTSPWITSIGGILIGGGMFLVAALVMRAPEPASVWNMMRRRARN